MSSTLDPRAIEREIGMIRERESNPYSSGIKTILFNLVILADGEEQAAAAAPALGHLLGRRPARIITVVGPGDEAAEGGRPEGLRAEVSGRCFPDTHSRGVCFEEIRITAAGQPVDVGAWAPLLIRDIPVCAWMPGLPSRGGIAAAVEAAEYIDTLIVDTAPARTLPEALAAVRSLRGLRSAARRSLAVSDMAWRRTFALRAQAARAFDPPEERARIASIRGVRAGSLAPSESLLFFLWLASRLGWKPGREASASGPGVPLFRDAAGRPVDLSLLPGVRRADDPRMSAGILFDAGALLECAAAAASDGEILLAEVDSPRQDPLLEDALDAAGEGG